MKILGRLVALFSGGLMVASILGTIAALVAKQRIVVVAEPDADEIKVAAIFEPIAFRSTARQFRGGSVDCWYGGGVIDLRGAVIDPAGAHLTVRAVFGGAQIVVPEAWRVTSHVVGIGGLGDGRTATERPEAAPNLTIDGLAIFGGYAVVSTISEEEMRGLEKAVEARQRRSPVASPDPELVPAV